MPLPSLPKAVPARPERAKSIADLLARQRHVTQSPRVPDSISLPFGGLSPEQLAHEREIAQLRVPKSNGALPVRYEQLVPDDPHSYVAIEPIETVEAEVVDDRLEYMGAEPSESDSPEPQPTVVHVHLHEAPKPKQTFPSARVIPAGSREARPLISAAAARADAAIAESDKLLSLPSPEIVEENIDNESEKLDRLIDDDFPFDDSQLAAVHGMVTHQFAAMVGEAGTGKTTVTKKFVDLLKTGVSQINLGSYWQRGKPEDDDDYEVPNHLVVAIAIVSFTGRASQMVKKNFPKSWHANIMTIHRLLGFYPEFYEDENERGELVNKKRFVPAYTAANPMPWKIIIVDEAGMLGLELWHQLLAACLPDTRIYFIGDIRQLPPTHGKSVLGFALAKWPVYALTHVHRQKGVNNSIVDNAHRVMNGILPICDSQVFAKEEFPRGLSFVDPKDTEKSLKWLATNKDWRFLNIRVDENPNKAQTRIRQVMKLLYEKTQLYDPNRDIIITPTNGFEPTAPGYVLGQMPLNRGLVNLLNAGATRYWIDAGREKQNFAVGDKVMATVNDYEAGITNGMTGIVESIAENGGYDGNRQRYGTVDEVAAYLESVDSDEDVDDIDLNAMIQAGRDALEAKEKEKRESGPASHNIVVRFGDGDHSFTVDFSSKSQVASLMLAYAATCHKMQGGEAPLVFVVVHGTQKRPLNREWLYTAITRASGRCVLLSTRQGLGTCLAKQSIKGKTLEDKIQSFVKLTEPNLMGAKINVRLPDPVSLLEYEGAE